MRQYQADTGIKLQRDNITLKTADGCMYVNATRVTGVDVFDPVQFTAAVLECYRQIEDVTRYLRARIPGFEKARIESIAPVLGVREKCGPAAYTSADQLTAHVALARLLCGSARAVQVRYRFDDHEWTDTILAVQHGFRVVRCRHEL